MNEGGMLKPALIAGVLLGILSAVPLVSLFNCFCCAWVIGGGILSASLYVKSSATAVSLGQGVALGALTGAIGAVVDLLFTIPLHFLMRGIGGSLMDQIREALERVPNVPPESKDALRAFLSRSSDAGFIVLIIGGFFTIMIYSIMAMLGGTIGVALFEK